MLVSEALDFCSFSFPAGVLGFTDPSLAVSYSYLVSTFIGRCTLVLQSQTCLSFGFDEKGDGSVILIKPILPFLGGVA